MRNWGTGLRQWAADNATGVAVVFLSTLLIYSALATGVVWTNHTIPNAYMYEYPTYKTWREGRWFADILIQVLGGGNQAFQAVLGFFIQAVNGFLFADIVRLEGRLKRTALALLIALHPTLLDYYVFTADNVSFTAGETLILCAGLIFQRGRWAGALAAGVLIFLALSIYQPKVGVAAVVSIAVLTVAVWTRPVMQVLRSEVPRVASAFAGAVALYLLVSRLLIADIGQRTRINSLAEIGDALLASYAIVGRSLVEQADNLPFLGTAGLALVLVAGALATLYRASRIGWPSLLAAALLLLALPPAIRLSFLVNDVSWEYAGRIVVGYAYAIGLMAAAIMGAGLRPVAIGGAIATAAAVYGFAYIGVQEITFMTMKTQYETAAINRIMARIEEVVPDDRPHPLVVIGDLRAEHLERFVQFPWRPYRPHSHPPTFIFYRHIGISNFYLGGYDMLPPTPDQAETAKAAALGRPLWPQPGSVFMAGDIVVVQLERADKPGVPVTAPN